MMARIDGLEVKVYLCLRKQERITMERVLDTITQTYRHYIESIKHLFLLVLFLEVPLCHTYADDFQFITINAMQGLSDNQIRYIFQLPDGRMTFTTSGSINLYDGVHFTNLHRTSEDIYPLSQYDGYYHIYLSADSLLWIKDHHRLMCVNLQKQQYITDLNSYFKNKGIEKPIDDLFVDDQRRIWLISDGKLLQQELKFNLKLSANQGKIQDLATDTHSLYLFYNTGELVCHNLKTGKQLYAQAAYPQDEEMKFRNTSLVVRGKDGFYQLRNGAKGGFFHFDTQQQVWTKIMEKDYTLNTLIISDDHKAYISCIRGLWIIDLDKGTQQHLPSLKTQKGSVPATEISTVFQDRQGALWLGTFNRGLLYYHPAMYKLVHTDRKAFSVSNEEDIAVTHFAEDKEGNIYIKERSAIYQLDVQEDGTRSLTPILLSSLSNELQAKLQSSRSTSFQNKSYTTLCRDSRGWIWAGTADGLELFGHDTQTEPRRFYREDGLTNNFVQAILEDRQHRIWVTTSNGISQLSIDPKTQHISITNYNQRDGTLEGEYIANSAFESSNGTLYFGGVDGFTTLPPMSKPAIPGLPYQPVFTAFYLHGERVIPAKAYNDRIILPKATAYTREISLKYNQNFITCEFSALNYFNPERTYYRYQLEGIDSNWLSTTNSKESNGILKVSYTNLPPGNYTLKVMASGDAGNWNEQQITKVNIIIHAPWWKTNLAYTVYLILLLIIIYASIRLYTYRTRKEMERRHKEEILLLRIRNLIEQCSRYESEQRTHAEETHIPPPIHKEEEPSLTPAEDTFLTQAIEQVEKNLHVPGYSVEQLSRDLCMERTGLYRKLVALLDQSPSLFIRNIRLQRAAQLILENRLSITEIAERTGFSSTSYLSKCFQEMYGCRPSEYAAREQKST